MPYNSWIQYRRQCRSIGLSKGIRQAYSARPLLHTHWSNHNAFHPALLPAALKPWMQNVGGNVTIITDSVSKELLTGIRCFGALLESVIGNIPPIIRASASGAVLYDRSTDRLYYGASRWRTGISIHATLAARVLQLPPATGPGGEIVRTHVPMRHAQTCAEFQALNEALLDRADEGNLELWCFRSSSMEAMSRCPNCRVTVPDHALSRIWTS